MLIETVIVLTGLAPGVHAMRVANGTERSEHEALDPEIGLVYTRCFEIACESVPGSVLQTYSLLKSMGSTSGGYSRTALASILLSALTTGFGSAVISFE
jgi:hypothetical protein